MILNPAASGIVARVQEQLGNDNEGTPMGLHAFTHSITQFLVADHNSHPKNQNQRAHGRNFALTAALDEQALNPKQTVVTPFVPFLASESGNMAEIHSRVPLSLLDRLNTYPIHADGFGKITIHSAYPISDEALNTVIVATDRLCRDLKNLYNQLRAGVGSDKISHLPHERGQDFFIPSYFAKYNGALTVIDIDGLGLKAANAKFGHPNGNQLIGRIARALISQRPEMEIEGQIISGEKTSTKVPHPGYYPLRYGGDEFRLLYDAQIMPPNEMMNRLRNEIEKPLIFTTPEGPSETHTFHPVAYMGHSHLSGPHEVREAVHLAEEERKANKKQAQARFIELNANTHIDSEDRMAYTR